MRGAGVLKTSRRYVAVNELLNEALGAGIGKHKKTMYFLIFMAPAIRGSWLYLYA